MLYAGKRGAWGIVVKELQWKEFTEQKDCKFFSLVPLSINFYNCRGSTSKYGSYYYFISDPQEAPTTVLKELEALLLKNSQEV